MPVVPPDGPSRDWDPSVTAGQIQGVAVPQRQPQRAPNGKSAQEPLKHQALRWWALGGSNPGPMDQKNLMSPRNNKGLALVRLQGAHLGMQEDAPRTALGSGRPE